MLRPAGFARPPAEPAVCSRSGGLCWASGLAAAGAEAGRHPGCRPHNAVEQGREINVGLELREMQAEPGGADLDWLQFVRSGVLQALRVSRRKRDIQAGSQPDDNALAPAV